MGFKISFSVFAGLSSLAFSQDVESQKLDSDLAQVERLVEVLERVHTQHVDKEKTHYARLVNHALEGALSSLDRFSYFYHPETYSAIKADESLDLTLPGLGFTLGKRDTGLYILSVTDHSAAAQAGILSGDSVIKISQKSVNQTPLKEALNSLRGLPGDTIKLSLTSRLTREGYDVSLTRRVTRTEPVSESFILENSNIGFIRLTKFTANAHTQLSAALDDLEARGMKKLIIDMRGNPGGHLDVAVAILGEFVPPRTEVVTTQTRTEGQTNLKSSFKTPERKRRQRDYPLAILIDRNSASAAELVPGSLQDLKRAKIVGETSYGKGSVQNITPLGNGAALRLTIATYHTPSGKTPHHVGITPDSIVEVTDNDRELLDIFQRRASATPEDRKRLNGWNDPVIAAAIATF